VGKWARKIIENELFSEAIGKRFMEAVKSLPTPKIELPEIEFPHVTPFPAPYQTATIKAGQEGRVYYYKIPYDEVGFIQYVANNYFPNTYGYWIVDSRQVITPAVELQLAPVNSPKPILPWMRVDDYIEWRVKNLDNEDHTFEVLIDGFTIRREEMPPLMRLIFPVGR